MSAAGTLPDVADLGGDAIMNGFKPAGVNYHLALRLTGTFKTAFPAGDPGAGTNKTAHPLTESKTETSVVLVLNQSLELAH